MERLHLLEVGVRWPPETFLGWRFEALARRGYAITVLSPKRQRHGAARLEGVRVRTLPELGEPRPRMLAAAALEGLALVLRRPAAAPRLWRAVRESMAQDGRSGAWETLARLRVFLPLARLRPDIVHFEWNPEAVRYLPLTEVWRCPTVSSCHGSGVNVLPHHPGEERFRPALERSFRAASTVHCVSDAIRREASRYGLDAAKVATIKSAVDPGRFRPAPGAPPREGRFGVVAVGFLRWLKGYEYALEAIRLLADRGVPVRLDVLGEDPFAPVPDSEETRRLLYTIDDLGLSGAVTLHGAVSSATVLARLQASQVLLHASLSEGLPTALLEAMACEVAVVATDCGGVREAVRDGVDGLVVAPRDSVRMADALQWLWEQPDLRHTMGRAGRERVLSAFTLDEQVGKFASLYEGLAGAHAGGRA
jgi:colanic acid/amylovoran biosynthesis glycosyltransferase